MSSEENWKYPDWIYAAEHKIKNIDTSKFLFPVFINHNVIKPEDNSYVKKWAICIKIGIDAKDRIDGGRTRIVSSKDGIYVYRSKDVEDVIFEELSSLIDHEVRECFQIREGNTAKSVIPFDPHAVRLTSLYAYRKVNGFPFHPTFRSRLWIYLKKTFKSSGKNLINLLTLKNALLAPPNL